MNATFQQISTVLDHAMVTRFLTQNISDPICNQYRWNMLIFYLLIIAQALSQL